MYSNTLSGNLYIIHEFTEGNNSKDHGLLIDQEGNYLTCESDFIKGNATHININEYYPTSNKELFSNDVNVFNNARSKWDNYLKIFPIGELKSYVWLLFGDYVKSGWMDLLSREVAFRGDSLEHIYKVMKDCNKQYPPYIWILWSNDWIYMGEQYDDVYKVVSVPKS